MTWDRSQRLCGNCDYWCLSKLGAEWWSSRDDMNPQGTSDNGTASECRADYPRWIAADGYGKWPVVHRERWCGKFKPRDQSSLGIASVNRS